MLFFYLYGCASPNSVISRKANLNFLVIFSLHLSEDIFGCYYLRTYPWQGGAGTWSDGKLVTRIGRNSNSVLAVRTITFLILYLLNDFGLH